MYQEKWIRQDPKPGDKETRRNKEGIRTYYWLVKRSPDS